MMHLQFSGQVVCLSCGWKGLNTGGYYNVANFFFMIFYLSIFANSETEPVKIPFGWVFGLFEGLAYFFCVFIVNRRAN